MIEDRPENIEPSPDSGRAKRAPPTIDLEATEVSSKARNTADGGPKQAWSGRVAISSTILSAVSGACAAALVIGMAWLLGWSGEVASPAASARNLATIDDLVARIARIESKTNKLTTYILDPAAAARVEALEGSLAGLRGELSGLRSRSDKFATTVDDIKSAPREPAPVPDFTAINERIAAVERATHAQGAGIAQEGVKPVDDVTLRRIVVAALLDILVRTGDPYAAALSAAKSLAPNPDLLKPLDDFAALGMPGTAGLSRELLTLVPKLSPPSPENSTTGTSLVDRLQTGAAKLVRIERTATNGSDRGNVVARITAAALRNDFNEARRELLTLTPADRAAAQTWIEKADARDAVLAVSRQFVAEAMATLSKPAP